ncbi:hypothetical protein [Vibrio fortis]|uniref:hypothetical protein n=1 Tax=Vibrio fortis TaxID=212667 RepID=UPI0038CD2097
MSLISKAVIDDCNNDVLAIVAKALKSSCKFNLTVLDSNNTILTEKSAAYLGSRIMIHAHLTNSPFTKVHFENGLEEAINLADGKAKLAPPGNPGHDITIAGERYSLKTQAGKTIRESTVHISKWMELGKNPRWLDDESVLEELRDEFVEHLSGYERVLTLRYLQGSKVKSDFKHYYELVEIPKKLLLLCLNGEFEMKHGSKQTVKPGYCHVQKDGRSLYSLYFDGGGERKLQIKNILKDECIVHATWEFDS